MSGPFNNEPLFPPKPVADEKLQSSQTGSKGKGRANQGGSGPGNASGGNKDKDGGAFDSHLFCYICNIKTTSVENMRDHINSNNHKQNAEREKQNSTLTQEEDTADDKPILPQPTLDFKKKESLGRTRDGYDKKWYCEVCKVATTCSENLEAHYKGHKHKNNLVKMGLQGNVGKSEPGPSDPPPKKMNVFEEIRINSHPLIGVECMTEYEHIEPYQDPHYECSVCQFMLMPGNVIPHLMGYKHRIKYAETFRPDLFNEYIRPTADKHNLLQSSGQVKEEDKRVKGTLSGRARDMAVELEKREGRRMMKTVVLRGQKVPSQLRTGQIHFSEIAKMGGMHDWSFKAVGNGWNFSEAAVNWGNQRGGPIGMGHGPGPMGMGPDGPGPRGMGPDGPGPMGMGPDGPGRMGMGPDGPGPMGMGPDGPGPRGMGPDGPGPRGMGPDGPGPMGMGPDGPGPRGMGPDGPGPRGMGHDGPGPMGMGPDGPGHMGMRPDGPGMMGMGPHGPGNMGMRPDGPGPMGMGQDGPGHMRGNMGMGNDGPGQMGMRQMGPEGGGAGWMGPRAEGPGPHAQHFFSEADINPELLSDEFITREYERRFGGKKKKSDQPPLPDSPPSKKPRPPPPPGNVPDTDADSSEKMQNLFNELSTSMIKNEEDASMALQVSNTLTQALLNYRLKSLPEGLLG